jgi:hypothetical protein
MKPLTKYQCEICSFWHNTEEEALKCEDSHLKVEKTATRYCYSPDTDTPYAIVVTFIDPKDVTHNRKIEVRYERERKQD